MQPVKDFLNKLNNLNGYVTIKICNECVSVTDAIKDPPLHDLMDNLVDFLNIFKCSTLHKKEKTTLKILIDNTETYIKNYTPSLPLIGHIHNMNTMNTTKHHVIYVVLGMMCKY